MTVFEATSGNNVWAPWSGNRQPTLSFNRDGFARSLSAPVYPLRAGMRATGEFDGEGPLAEVGQLQTLCHPFAESGNRKRSSRRPTLSGVIVQHSETKNTSN